MWSCCRWHRPTLHSESVPLLGIEQDALQQMALRAGAKDIQFFGDYRQQPYDRLRSTDLIMVAIRRVRPW